MTAAVEWTKKPNVRVDEQNTQAEKMNRTIRPVFAALFSVGLSLCAAAQNARAEIALLQNPVKKGKVAFTYIRGKQSDAYAISFADGKVVALVETPQDDEFPVWSPDGTRLAYYSDATGDREVYVSDAQGKNPLKLTDSKGVDEDPDWSPDGKQIVFRSERGGGSNLFVINADGTGLSQLTSSGTKKTVPRWSADGSKMLYVTNAHWPGWDIEMLDLTSKAVSVMTNDIRTSCHPAWQPNQKGFVYSHGGGSKVNLWVKTLAGEDIRLTEYDGKDYDAAWIDDDQILFCREQNPGKEDYQLYHLRLSTKQITRLTDNDGAIRDLSYTAHD